LIVPDRRFAGITIGPVERRNPVRAKQEPQQQKLEKSKLMVDIAFGVWDKARMFKRLQQLEITSPMAVRASAVAVDGAALRADLSLILVLVLIVIPLASGVAMIL
jgi:hypothetical protein